MRRKQLVTKPLETKTMAHLRKRKSEWLEGAGHRRARNTVEGAGVGLG